MAPSLDSRCSCIIHCAGKILTLAYRDVVVSIVVYPTNHPVSLVTSSLSIQRIHGGQGSDMNGIWLARGCRVGNFSLTFCVDGAIHSYPKLGAQHVPIGRGT